MFFNPSQFRVREGIINSLEKFGHPRLEESGDSLAVRVGASDAQTLFAYDTDSRIKVSHRDGGVFADIAVGNCYYASGCA